MSLVNFGIYFNSIRMDKGITILELARRSGMSMEYISRLECGVRRPSAAILKILATALDVDIAEFLSTAESLLGDDVPAPELERPHSSKALLSGLESGLGTASVGATLTPKKQKLLNYVAELGEESISKVTAFAEKLLEEQHSLAIVGESNSSC